MPRLAANLTFLFTDLPFLDRFAAAADAGFAGVEFLFPYDFRPADIAARASAAGVQVVLFNGFAGDWSGGERGLACLAGRQADFRASIAQALDYARALDCPTLHVLAGIPDAPQDAARRRYAENLGHAAEQAAASGRTIVIEPLNRRDVPGYLLCTSDEAAAIVGELDRPNLGIQFDLYHAQISEGDLTRRLEALMPLIRHVQIAGVPARNEPAPSEIDPHHLLHTLDALGYRGWVGCEYTPRTTTQAGLGWAAPYLGR